MSTPATCDPVAWAEHNARQAELISIAVTEPHGAMPHDDATADLCWAVVRAISELQGQGARSDRIAAQLDAAVRRAFLAAF